MRTVRIPLVTLTVIFSLAGFTSAQISSGGEPASFKRQLSRNVPVLTMPEVDVAALLAEDEEDAKLDVPFRFGFPHDVNYNLDNSGVWETLDDGGKLWRLAINCPGAYSINIVYDQYRVPNGARFYLYTPDKQMVLGAFTSRNNKDHGKFATAPTSGDKVILEYYLPAGFNDRGELSLGRVVHGYKNIFFGRQKDLSGFGGSGDCNINVHCPEGAPWQDEIRSVAMIITDAGTRLCSGALVNNVRQDMTPYFLSANHCLGSEPTWIVMFNYESPSCDNIDGPTWMTVQGTTLRANNDYSDFALLELSEDPPPSFNVYYAGWSATDESFQQAVCIHHPSGDIKKISFDLDTVVETSRLDVSGDGYWRVIEWDLGTTEGGSSGSPLFDPDHRVVGQLYGGYASCKRLQSDWFGQFSESWDYGATPDTRLKDWLDPDNTGTLILDGIDGQCCVGLRGNADSDPEDLVDIMDVVFLAQWLWAEGEEPSCMEEADVDGSGITDLMDIVYIASWLFESGPEPVSCP